MSEIQAELVKTTKIKPDKFDDRQDFLAAIIRHVSNKDKFTDDQFDALSDEAAAWINDDAAPALKGKDEIPDFPDADEAEADEPEAEGEEAPADEEVENHEADAEAESDNEAEEAEADAKPAKAKKAAAKPAKPAKPAKAKAEAAPAKKAAKAEKPDKAEKADKRKIDPARYDKITGERDRFGVIEGTKTAEAVALYSRKNGATASEIDEQVGGRHYNILTKLQEDGHKVEKHEGGRWILTHKDDLKAAKKGK